MKRTTSTALAALLAMNGSALAEPPAKPNPTAPQEVLATAPAGTKLLAFQSSGEQADATAIAVFESAPDKNDSQFRTMVVFGKKDGVFKPDFSNDKIIACSNCDQYHGDSFDITSTTVSAGRIEINQFDAGEKPSTTMIELKKVDGIWHAAKASRQNVFLGRGPATSEALPLPTSGLAKDMDGKWSYVAYLNTIMVNHANGKAMFLHKDRSPDLVWKHVGSDCNPQDCTIVVQQGDGCMSLVRDSAGRSFGAGTPDPRNKKEALDKAMSACSAAGGQACKQFNTECTRGIF
jgi:hypothetical protein